MSGLTAPVDACFPVKTAHGGGSTPRPTWRGRNDPTTPTTTTTPPAAPSQPVPPCTIPANPNPGAGPGFGVRSVAPGHGYTMVASDGGIFTFGDAGYYGSEGGSSVDRGPIVGMAATPDGKGLLVGGLRRRASSLRGRRVLRINGCHHAQQADRWYGRHSRTERGTGWSAPTEGSSPSATAGFYGSTGAIKLNKPIVGMAPTPDGQRATTWWPPTVGSSPSVTPFSGARREPST